MKEISKYKKLEINMLNKKNKSKILDIKDNV